MRTTRNEILESAYIGICNSAENGYTQDYGPGDVSAPNFLTDSFTVTLRDTGERVVVRVEEPS